MPVSRRRDTGKWGYRHYSAGKNYRRHGWDTRAEAVEAYKELLDRLAKQLPVVSVSDITLLAAVNEFLLWSSRIGKSDWRLKALYANFKRFILPILGPQTLLRSITHLHIEAFIDFQIKRGEVTRNTINSIFKSRQEQCFMRLVETPSIIAQQPPIMFNL